MNMFVNVHQLQEACEIIFKHFQESFHALEYNYISWTSTKAETILK